MTRIERLQETGILRTGSPKRGFSYRHADGRAISASDRRRIAALRVPPAWRSVAVNASAAAALQAVGQDAAGRWQYRYHASHERRRERLKFARVLEFANALPRMRRSVARDLAKGGLGRETVMACALRILATCFLRPGSQVYADENGSFGIATLRPSHVTVSGDTVVFDFMGKSKKRQRRELRDAAVARTVRSMLRVPGKEVFKFTNGETGRIVDVRRRHINQYIKSVMGQAFSAKDFRTWAATLICAGALARTHTNEAESAGTRRLRLLEAIRETATHLGNTPAVCRSSYISPAVFRAYERGRVIEPTFATLEELARRRSRGLHPSERALLRMMRSPESRSTPSLASLLRQSLATSGNTRALRSTKRSRPRATR